MELALQQSRCRPGIQHSSCGAGGAGLDAVKNGIIKVSYFFWLEFTMCDSEDISFFLAHNLTIVRKCTIKKMAV